MKIDMLRNHDNYNENDVFMYYVLLASCITAITFLAGCVCCRKKTPKNELLGLEGLVKITNPDEQNANGTSRSNNSAMISSDPNILTALSASSDLSNSDLRRSSNAPHRSLPDIPISDQVGDTNSELYATVGDKVLGLPQGSASTAIKPASVSQHSSLSQADDISSPYARVKAAHDYDKVRHHEHPYAHINQSGPSSHIHLISEESATTTQSQNSPTGLDSTDGGNNNNETSHEIPAASAIAGHIAASQDLPYMTPPIVQPPQQNFSGDSQDSSKGYTSISVREPLANIIAQTNQQRQNAKLRRGLNESDYATVSDDSDEMYAAIDDPNNQGDLYTSGSETYAQIQPPSGNLVTVAVEINPAPRISQEIVVQGPTTKRLSGPGPSNQIQTQATINQPMHSRQASSSSCTSSVGNLGSPKPEKRQANSPLPPPPKNSVQSQTGSSGRNSIVSVIEVGTSGAKESASTSTESKSAKRNSDDGNGAAKKKQSPIKDLEGMYAKVMKKNKLSNLPSQNSSPVLPRKQDPDAVEIDPSTTTDAVAVVKPPSNPSSPKKSIVGGTADNNYETIDKRRGRSSSFDSKDPGYETIPGDKTINVMNKSFNDYTTPSTGHAEINEDAEPGYESLHNLNKNADPGYESVTIVTTKPPVKPDLASSQRISLDYDPNYEVLRPTLNHLDDHDASDDGYAKVLEKNNKASGGNHDYSSIKKPSADHKQRNHDYASIKETKIPENGVDGKINNEMSISLSPVPVNGSSLLNSPAYSTISETTRTTSSLGSQSSDMQLVDGGYQPIGKNSVSASTSKTTSSGCFESLTGSESDPNYEFVKYTENENPYERLVDDKSPGDVEPPKSVSTPLLSNVEVDGQQSGSMTTSKSEDIMTTTKTKVDNSIEVSDFFQV